MDWFARRAVGRGFGWDLGYVLWLSGGADELGIEECVRVYEVCLAVDEPV